MTTLASADMLDLVYELNDSDLFNDILAIVGESEAEILERGYDAASILLYGRRSYRIDRPIGVDDPGETGIVAMIEKHLDRFKDPYAVLTVTLVSKTSTLAALLLDLEISDVLHIHETNSGIDDDFIVENISLDVANGGVTTGTIGMVQARADE